MMKVVLGFALGCSLLTACNDSGKESGKKGEGGAQTFGTAFNEGGLPYQLTDTGLLKNKDTVSLPPATVASLIADSIRSKYFGKNATIKYTALAKLTSKEKQVYYLIKVAAGTKKGVLLMVFDAQNNFGAAYPLLFPDADPTTSQISFIDKNFTITKSVTQRAGAEVTGEGKEVVAYDAASKTFSLIMTDLLNDTPAELINPIDTFPKKNKLAGDYYLNKKNIVAVRDGRYPNQVLVYIHTENEEGDCKGELKGEFLMTSPATAAYRLGGDPCVLGLSFAGNSVTIKEESGCGNHRGLDCPLSGTFTRKKQQQSKQTLKKGKSK